MMCPGMDMERIFFEEAEDEGKFIGMEWRIQMMMGQMKVLIRKIMEKI